MIFSNLAISVDGKIAAANRGHCPLGSVEDRRRMRRLRCQADAIIMGASTIRSYKLPCLAMSADGNPAKRQPVNVIVSHSLEGISPSWNFFTSEKIRRYLFVKKLPKGKKLRQFEKSSAVVILRRESIAPQIVRVLNKLGHQNLLVEGGGEIMWEFSKLKLIDRYYITLTPKVVGGKTAPTLIDGTGFKSSQIFALKLKKASRVGSEIFLQYEK
jgi:riboflavin-specific deaminase-like protein